MSVQVTLRPGSGFREGDLSRAPTGNRHVWKGLRKNLVFKDAVDRFGERGIVDLTGVMGYYCFVSMMLNIDRYPLPEGETPELKPLR